MAKTYKPAVFQPTVRPDWGGVLSYIPDTEKSEILVALFKYPSVECSSRFWLETIKPELDSQFEEFKRQCELKSRGIRERWGKMSITSLQDKYNTSNTQDIDSKRERENKEESKNKSIDENTLFKAGFQNWVFPTEIKKIAAKHWSAETIREIEKQFSCQEYTTETSISDLLQQYPENKTKRFVKPTVEEVKAYCRERMNMVNAEKFMNYYESNGWKVGKNPMKDWKATVRTWEKSSFNNPQPQKKNWSNYIGEGSFLRDAKDDPFLEDIFNKKD